MRVLAACLACSLGLLAGCATSGTTSVVKVPVPVPCTIPPLPRPVLPVDTLAVDANVFTAARAAWASISLLEGWAGTAEAAMQACR